MEDNPEHLPFIQALARKLMDKEFTSHLVVHGVLQFGLGDGEFKDWVPVDLIHRIRCQYPPYIIYWLNLWTMIAAQYPLIPLPQRISEARDQGQTGIETFYQMISEAVECDY